MPLKLKVITPEKILIDTEVDEFYSTATDGDFGIMPGHIPYDSSCYRRIKICSG